MLEQILLLTISIKLLSQKDCDLEGPRQFIFEENESLRAKTIDERIGRVFTTFQPSETKANQSTAEGK